MINRKSLTLQLPAKDLDYILRQTGSLWEDLRDQRLLITGGTGFFGCWLLESFIRANQLFNLNASAVILTRHPARFEKKCPHFFKELSISFYKGDVRNFKFPQGKFDYVIHAATEVAGNLNLRDPKLMFDSIVQGTKHILDFARQAGVNTFLLISSGAVYGKQNDMVTEGVLFSELGDSAYALGKREAESICAEYAMQFNLAIKIARCFAFVGPYLPLDDHFAIGNFIRDGLKQTPIIVQGDGTAYRSYLYAADLAIWLWTILLCGETMRPYNVGSDEAITIGELARRVAGHFEPAPEVRIKQPRAQSPSEWYVPDISRVRKELGLIPGRNLDQALDATIHWYRDKQ